MIFASRPALAQLLLEEGKVERTVNPGETIVASLSIHNTASYGVNVRLYWEDFMYTPPYDGTKKFLPAGSLPTSAIDMVRFDPQNITMEPFTKQKINYTIRVPQDIKGGYYGVLFAEQDLEEASKATGVRIISRVGCLFFLEAVDKNKSAKLENLFIEDGSLIGAFVNEGDVIEIPKAVYYVLDSEGLAVSRGEIEEFYLPMNDRYQFKIAIPEELDRGRYNMVLTFDLGEGGSIVKEINFVKDVNSNIELLAISD